MKEYRVQGSNIPEAYHKSLMILNECGEIADCADWNTRQKEVAMTIHVKYPLEEPMISRCFIGDQKSLQQYIMEMLDGILDFEIEKGNWAYTYHDRMVNLPIDKNLVANQVEFIVAELKRNPSSRRAVITVRDSAKDMMSDDPACLQHIQYFIRNNKLDCMVLFRSNDACKATFMNMFALVMLQKRIAYELGIEVGTYTHRANSFHCYEKDFDLLNGYCARINKCDIPDDESLTYEYVDDWKDDMEDYVDEILKTAEELKNR